MFRAMETMEINFKPIHIQAKLTKRNADLHQALS